MSQRQAVRRELDGLVTETRARVRLVAQVTGVLWAIELLDLLVLGQRLDAFGVAPRTLHGLAGIFAAPFLHGGIAHIAANTVPLIALGILATARKRMDFWVVAFTSTVVGGLGTWLIAPPGSVHIGASGVVFGLLGFLMGRGIFERRLSGIALSAVVTFLFGGMLWGVLPIIAGAGISWQMHLFGYLGGLLVSWRLGKALRKKR